MASGCWPRTRAAALPALQRACTGKALCDDAIVEALNVKTAMFFLAFIPQFVSTQQTLAPQFILPGSICVLLNTAVDLLAVAAATRFVAAGTSRVGRARWLSRLSGATMLALGIMVALA